MTDTVQNDAEKYNAILAVHQALMHKPTDFKDTINHLLADRLEKAVENKREEVARSIFNGEQPEEPTVDSVPEAEDTEEAVESEPVTDTEEEETEELQPEE